MASSSIPAPVFSFIPLIRRPRQIALKSCRPVKNAKGGLVVFIPARIRCLGRIEQYRQQFDSAATRFERALQLAPNHASTLIQLAACFAYNGNPGLGLELGGPCHGLESDLAWLVLQLRRHPPLYTQAL